MNCKSIWRVSGFGSSPDGVSFSAAGTTKYRLAGAVASRLDRVLAGLLSRRGGAAEGADRVHQGVGVGANLRQADPFVLGVHAAAGRAADHGGDPGGLPQG